MYRVLQTCSPVLTPKSYIVLTLVRMMFFISEGVLWFYLRFEVRVLPICYIIMRRGYQPERSPASLRLLLYTLAGSIPFLASLVIYFETWGVKTLLKVTTSPEIASIASFLGFTFLLCFFVKLPVYFAHM